MDKAHDLQLKAFNAQVVEHQDSLYNLALWALGDEKAASEATQAAVLHAYKTLHSHQSGSMRLWLLRSVVIHCRQRLHRKGTPAGRDHHDLANCLRRLPLELCLVITLVELEGLDYDQAAAVLDQPRRTVVKRLAEARHRMVEGLPAS